MKKLIMTISNEGSSTKSTTAKYIKETFMRRGISHATYLCDKDHRELIDTYGDEVKYFNIREDHEALINILAEDFEYIIVDFPASSFDELYKIFGDMQTFLDSFTMFNALPIFAVPIISDKSILSVDRLASLLKGVESTYEIIYVLAESAMKNKGEVHLAFNNNEHASKQIADGIAKVITITTKFTPNFASIVKKEKLRDFLTKTGTSPMDKVLMFSLTREIDSQFSSALGLQVADDRTGLEKGFRVDTTKIAIGGTDTRTTEQMTEDFVTKKSKK